MKDLRVHLNLFGGTTAFLRIIRRFVFFVLNYVRNSFCKSLLYKYLILYEDMEFSLSYVLFIVTIAVYDFFAFTHSIYVKPLLNFYHI